MFSHLARAWACYVALAAGAVGLAGCKPATSPVFEWVEDEPASEPALAPESPPPTAATAPSDMAATAAGAGGSELRGESGRPPIDVNVEFDWSQTSPGRENCSGAVYIGAYTCTLNNGLNAPTPGTIVLDMRGPSETTQQLALSRGAINLLTDEQNMTSFALPVETDPVQCTARKLNGRVPAIMFTAEQTGVGFSVLATLFCGAATMFEGRLSGTLSSDGQSFIGEAALTLGTCTCTGAFDLRAQR